jgi:hypothetical protein
MRGASPVIFIMSAKKERYKSFHSAKEERIKQLQSLRNETLTDPTTLHENERTIAQFFREQRKLKRPEA